MIQWRLSEHPQFSANRKCSQLLLRWSRSYCNTRVVLTLRGSWRRHVSQQQVEVTSCRLPGHRHIRAEVGGQGWTPAVPRTKMEERREDEERQKDECWDICFNKVLVFNSSHKSFLCSLKFRIKSLTFRRQKPHGSSRSCFSSSPPSSSFHLPFLLFSNMNIEKRHHVENREGRGPRQWRLTSTVNWESTEKLNRTQKSPEKSDFVESDVAWCETWWTNTLLFASQQNQKNETSTVRGAPERSITITNPPALLCCSTGGGQVVKATGCTWEVGGAKRLSFL